MNFRILCSSFLLLLPCAAQAVYIDEVLADNPIRLWRLDETGGTTATDQAAGNNGTYINGALLNQPGLVPVQPQGTSVSFDGTNDGVTIPGTLPVNNTGAGGPPNGQQKTIEFWFNADVTSRGAGGNDKMVLYEQGGATLGINVYLVNDQLVYNAWNNSNDAGADNPWGGPASTGFTSTPVTAGSSHHVALVYQHSATPDVFDGSVTGYLDGQQVGQTTGLGRLFGHGDANALGGVNGSTLFGDGTDQGSSQGNERFDGRLSEVAFFDAALGADQVQRHFGASQLAAPVYEYNAQFDPNSANATWEHNANNSLLSAGTSKNRDLSLTGVTFEPAPGSDLPGINAAYTFDNNAAPGDRATSTTHAGNNPTLYNGNTNLDRTSASFEIWFRPDRASWNDIGAGGAGPTGEILFENGGGNGFGIGLRNPGGLDNTEAVFSLARSSVGQRRQELVIPLTDALGAPNNDFIQLVGVVDPDNSQMAFYLDGQLVASGLPAFIGGDPGAAQRSNGILHWWNGSSDDFGLGGRGGSNMGGFGGGNSGFESFLGDIAIFRAYDNALTASQVEALFNFVSGIAPGVGGVPEPASVLMYLPVLFALGWVRRRRPSASR